ncbi:D-amino acid dehydrogenase small subunit [Micromonospora sp. MW-13]|uniref:NAD(P)/FAD-dependent oxidoreductase n=1 Tax=Micromonospora sp. MW-13 TaxID=2094022 RepID=UPI000E431530|nr:FAD-dependent oxidoreductase [Micromonospora sp. MW-13]RGC66816.1 D-amino acid dehydrogenase small subunit [Micromonospora sp. MW-13]
MTTVNTKNGATASRPTVLVGGGVLGLCVAWELARCGHRVVVLERDRVGSGASRGNAGEICSPIVGPLPAPGIVSTALKNMYRKDSALYVHPMAALTMGTFLLQMARNATAERFRAGVRALAQLGADTYDRFAAMSDSGVDIEVTRREYLYLFPSRDRAERKRAFLREHYPVRDDLGELLDGPELLTLERCLGERARAGFVLSGQAQVDPSTFVDALADALRANGVVIHEGARVTRIEPSSHEVRVESSVDTFAAGHVVVAAGAGSAVLTANLGLDLPVRAGKGYSFSIAPAQPLTRVLKLEEAHVGAVPLGDGVRIAGTMEFDAREDSFNPNRIREVVNAAAPYFTGVDWTRRTAQWMGARPMTPDGLPFIGAAPGHSRVYLATGHNMLGVMMAPSTAHLLARLIGGHEVPALRPFDPARALGRRARPVNRTVPGTSRRRDE